MERYTSIDYRQIEASGELQRRLDFANSVGNFQVDAERLRRAMLRAARAFFVQERLPQAEIDRLAPAPPPAWRGMPTVGTVRIFALLIDFADQPHTNDAGAIDDALFGAPTTGTPYESLAAYYRRASYGKLDLSGGATLGWYRAGAKRADVAQTTAGREGLIKEAIRHFAAGGHNFRQYDNNGDGVIDYFLVFWSGPDNGWANFWWGYQTGFSDTSFKVDGVGLGKYSWQWEARPVGSAFNPRVPIHETGHALGLPDLYDYNDSVGPKGGVGGLDMMDANQHDHNCFHKWMLDWLTPAVIASGRQTLTLRPSGTTEDCVVVWPGVYSGNIFSEMFIVQNRQRVGNDAGLPNEGLLIWHVDASLDQSGAGFAYDNSYTAHKFIRLMEADGHEDIEKDYAADAGDFYGPAALFAPTTMPSSACYNGTTSGVSVSNISILGDDITATFEIVELAVAAIYEDDNYGGRSQALGAGRYDLGTLTIGNDTLSSVKVPPGWRVTLYEHAGFGGRAKALTADTPALPDFNDLASSVVVEAAVLPVVFEHDDYGGRGQVLGAGRYDLGALSIGNDVVSSAKVPPGWRVTLYQHAGFAGATKALIADTPALPDFNDTASSIVVEAAAVPVVYEHSDYGGRCQALDAGRYDLSALSIGNDVISSVKVPPGWRVTLYEHAGYQGRAIVLIADTPAFPNFNDTISSILVEAAAVPVVYEHNDYGGRCQALDSGRYDLGALSIGNDVISSVKVPPGWRVTLYEHAGFGGRAKALTTNTPALPGFNDLASSVVVEAAVLPVVFEHNDYGGRNQVLGVGRYDLSQLSIGNDVVSSAKVPPGWRVTLYQHAGFVGAVKVLTTNTPALPDFNDTASSIVAERV